MNCIIGGSGFVGSELISRLGKNKCLNIDKNLSPFHNEITTIGDIRFEDQIKLNSNVSCVVLLAAEHRDDVSPVNLYYDVNVIGTKNVLKKMDLFEIKHLIFTSSVAIYGLNKNNPKETNTHDPFNDYGKSKWLAEQIIKDWYLENPNEKSVTIIRPTVIFGERNRGNVYNLMNHISSGKFIMAGNGKNKKSMAYVKNVVAFIINRLQKSKPGFHIYNYADKPDLDMNNLLMIIRSKMGLNIYNFKLPYWIAMLIGYIFDFVSYLTQIKFSISSVRVKKFCATTQFDSTKCHKCFKAPFTLKQGIDRTIEFEFLNTKKDDIQFFSK